VLHATFIGDKHRAAVVENLVIYYIDTADRSGQRQASACGSSSGSAVRHRRRGTSTGMATDMSWFH
jgi:hypothetical protein